MTYIWPTFLMLVLLFLFIKWGQHNYHKQQAAPKKKVIGEIDSKRVTGTRIILFGPLAWGLRKKEKVKIYAPDDKE